MLSLASSKGDPQFPRQGRRGNFAWPVNKVQVEGGSRTTHTGGAVTSLPTMMNVMTPLVQYIAIFFFLESKKPNFVHSFFKIKVS